MDRLRLACQDLTADKITVRKKAVECVRDLLSNPGLLTELRVSSGFGTLYNCVVQAVVKEGSRVDYNGDNHLNSSSVRGCRDAMGLLKLVFSKANANRSFRLDANRVLDDLLHFINDIRLRRFLAADALQLLLEHVLKREQCLAAISCGDLNSGEDSNKWRRLFDTVFGLFTTSNVPQGLSFLSLLQCLYLLLHWASVYTCLLTPSLLSSKTSFFIQIVTERYGVSSIDERRAILKASSLFTKLLAVEDRKSLCELGESCLSVILSESTEKQSSTMKELFEWVALQVAIHHPKGAVNVDEGACFHNESHWRRLLLRCYIDFVDANLNEISKVGLGDDKSSELFFQMATKVSYQVYIMSDSVNDISISQEEATQQWSRSGHKRRRVSVTFEDHLLKLTSGWETKTKQEEALPWVQLLNQLITTFPSFMAADEMRRHQTFRALTQALLECKLSTVRQGLFECCVAIIDKGSACSTTSNLDLTKFLESVGAECSKGVQWRNASFEASHHLVRLFLTSKELRHFIDDQAVLKACFKREQSQDELCNSLKTVIAFLQCSEAPFRLATTIYFHPGVGGSEKDASNFAILHWLHSCLDRHNNQEEQTSPFWMTEERENLNVHNSVLNGLKRDEPFLLSHFYHLLMSKNPRHLQEIEKEKASTKQILGENKDTESLLLYGSLMSLPSINEKQTSVNVEPLQKVTVRVELASSIRETILKQSAQILHQLKLTTASGAQFERFKEALAEIGFLLHFLNHQLKFGLLPLDEKFDNSNPNHKIYNSLKSLATFCSDIMKKTYLGCLHSLDKVAFFFNWLEQTLDCSRLSTVIKALLIHVLPVDSLVERSLSVHMVRLEGCREGSSQAPRIEAGTKKGVKRAKRVEIQDDMEFEDVTNDSVVGGSSLPLVPSVSFLMDTDSVEQEGSLSETHYVQSMAIVLRGASLLCCPPFEVILDNNSGNLATLTETLNSLFELSLQPDLSEKEKTVLQNGIFDAFDIIAKAKNAVKDKEDFLIGFLRRLPQSWFPKSNFRPKNVVRTVILLQHLMEGHKDRSNEQNDMVEMLLMGFLNLNGKSNYQRFSLEIQEQIVRLLALFPSSKTLPIRFFNICAQGIRELELDEDDSEEPLVSSALLPFLACSPFFQLRLEASKALSETFQSEVFRQQALLDTSKPFLKHLIESEQSSKPECALLTLALLMRNSTNDQLRRVVSQLLLLSSHLDQLNESFLLTKRALSLALDVTSIESFLEATLSSLLNAFLKEKGSLATFPIRLFQCEDLRTFALKYESKVVSLWFWNEPTETMLMELASIMEKGSRKALVANSFAHISALYLPLTVANDHKGLKNVSKARKMDAAVLNILGQDLFNNLLNENIGQVLAEVFAMVNVDKNELEARNLDFIGEEFVVETDVDFEHHPSHITGFVKAIQTMLVPKGSTLFSYLSCELERRDVLQVILSRLLSVLQCTASMKKERLQSLVALCLLLECLEEMEIKSEYFVRHQLPFLVHYISVVLLSVIKNEDESLALRQLSCKVLFKVIKVAYHSEECFQHLLRVHSTMVAMILGATGVASECLKVMRQLYVIHPNQDWPSLPSDIDAFRALQSEVCCEVPDRTASNQLQDCIKLVLSSHSDEVFPHLRTLHGLLEGDIPGLSHMQQKMMRSQGFSEDAICSLLHQLVNHLISLLKSPVSSETSDHILKCLAQLGPLNLGTQVLKIEPVTVAKMASKSLESFLPLLADHLMNNIGLEEKLSNASARALKAVCSCNDNSHLSKTLFEPFKVGMEVNNENVKLIEEIDLKEDFFSNSNLVKQNSSQWVTEVVLALLRLVQPDSKHIYCELIPVAELDEKFCELLLPQVIHDLLIQGGENIKKILCKAVNEFFCDFYNNSDHQSSERSEYRCSLQVMLNLVEHLRRQPTEEKSSMGPKSKCSKDNKKWVTNFVPITDINYLHVAKAALHCSAFFSANLYTELWCQRTRDKHPEIDKKASCNDSEPLLLHLLKNPQLESEAKAALSILNSASISLGEEGAMVGAMALIDGNKKERIEGWSRQRKHLQAINAIDTLSTTANNKDAKNVTCHLEVSQALMQAGLHSLLHTYLSNSVGNSYDNSTALVDYQYECAWRLGKWDDEVLHFQEGQNGSSFSRNHYEALRDLFHNDADGFESNVKAARAAVCKELLSGSQESTVAVMTPLAKLRLIEELEILSKESTDTSKQKFKDYDSLITPIQFSRMEPVMLQRCLLAEMRSSATSPLKNRPSYRELSSVWGRHYVEKCRYHGMNKMAETHLARMTSTRYDAWQRFSEAQLLFDANEADLAKTIMANVASDLGLSSENASNEQRELLVRSLLCLGEWSACLRTENSGVIIKKYFEKAVSYQTSNMDSCLRAKSFLSLAKYCDQQHSLVLEQMTSKDYEEKQRRVQLMRRDAQEIQASMNKEDRDALKTTAMLERNSNLDDLELQNLAVERQRYLNAALINYGKALAIDHQDFHDANNETSTRNGGSSEAMLFRLVALWVSNARRHEDINQVVSDLLDQVDSSKFVPLLFQLAARLNANSKHSFELVLYKLVSRCAKEHTWHALPILLGMNDCSEVEANLDGRGQAVSRIINELKAIQTKKGRKDGKLCQSDISVEKTQQLWKILVQLADHKIANPTNKTMKNPIQMPNDVKSALLQLKSKSGSVCLLTSTTPVRRDREYTTSEYISTVEYRNSFRLVGGITQPKRLECLASDGKWRPQLLKGNEDVRQDAVMQQVFGLINNCLQQTDATRAQRMQMRTYKVVPLSRTCGLIEWCENTTPLKEYLIGGDGESGAHSRFRPTDISGKQCRQMMMEADKKYRKQSNRSEKMLKSFENICEKFKPVLRYFFFEHFVSQSQFYERRWAFVRSTAVSSMVGYIMGLGDRHVQNILLDKFSAEMIHIDLGVAFDQGRILPYPETIPFRLTRDIVDGFGACGLEYSGFVKCCEDTLNALRESRQRIETILDVLVHDPLHDWSVNAQKASKLQNEDRGKTSYEERTMSEGDKNALAQRVLMRVEQKLSGQELGGVLSTQGQVNALIQQARDPKNLALLFPGWQPYL